MGRHGFVSFYLWFGVIGSIIIILTIFFSDNYFNQYFGNEIDQIFIVIGCLINIITNLLILNWYLSGFWISCVYTIGIQFFIPDYGFKFRDFIISLIVILIFYGVLNIKKNGISTWDYLTGKEERINRTCPFCANCIKKEAIVCQFCGRDVSYDIVSKIKVSDESK